ncbi:TIGR00269 family protein [Candidatus Undinarchaeota archaeon]
MIKTNDHVAVGYSGGKNSALALYKVVQLSKKLPIQVTAITIDEGIKQKAKYIRQVKKYCKELKVEHKIASFKELFGITMDEFSKKKLPQNICSYCAVYKRKALNKTALDLKADKLVVGHNLDNETQSIMMNYSRGELERSSRLGPKSDPIYPGFVQRLKPLRNVPDSEVLAYCEFRKIPFCSSKCPYSQKSYREDIKEMLNNFEEIHPGTKQSVLNSFDEILPILKKTYYIEKLNACSDCGEPTIGKICKPCAYLKKYKG